MMEGYVVCVVLLGFVSQNVIAEGTFWQVTDIHVDSNYSENGDIRKHCHKLPTTSSEASNGSLGHFGDYNCDSPWPLVESAISAMKQINPGPDFILWTGDILPHGIYDNVTSEEVFSTLKRTTDLLDNTFPDSLLIPVVGNHDVHPANEFPEKGFKNVYQNFLTKGSWDLHVPPEELHNFRKGGYYARDLAPRIRVLVLNTNIYLFYNTKRPTEPDPADQFQWMITELKHARENQTKVIITAHSPPGFFERKAEVPFLASPYNEKLIDILVNHSSIILTQIYGHTHTDTFRLFSGSDDVVKTHAFIAPSVAPSRVVDSSGINPSIRLYKYTNDAILDYNQYFLNLTLANRDNDEHDNSSAPVGQNASRTDDAGGNLWHLLYTATQLYGLTNLNLTSLGKMYLDIATKPERFATYLQMNTAGVAGLECDANCKRTHICAFRMLTVPQIEKCLARSTTTTTAPDDWTKSTEDDFGHHHHHHRHLDAPPYMKHIILGISLMLLMILLLVTAVCLKRIRHKLAYRYTRHYSLNTE